MKRRTLAVVTSVLVLASRAPAAQQPPVAAPPEAQRTFADPRAYLPDLSRPAASTSELRDLVDRFALDRQALQRFYTVPGSDERRARLRAFQQAWLEVLPRIDFARLSREAQVDYILL